MKSHRWSSLSGGIMYASIYPEAPYLHEIAQYERDAFHSKRQYLLRRAMRLGLDCWAYMTIPSLLLTINLIHFVAIAHV